MASAPAAAIAASASAASAQLVVEDQRVEGDVALDAAPVQRAHDLGQFVQREADLGAGGEVLQPEVDGIGAGFDGGVKLRPVAGRAHDFGLDRRHWLLHNVECSHTVLHNGKATAGICVYQFPATPNNVISHIAAIPDRCFNPRPSAQSAKSAFYSSSGDHAISLSSGKSGRRTRWKGSRSMAWSTAPGVSARKARGAWRLRSGSR